MPRSGSTYSKDFYIHILRGVSLLWLFLESCCGKTKAKLTTATVLKSTAIIFHVGLCSSVTPPYAKEMQSK